MRCIQLGGLPLAYVDLHPLSVTERRVLESVLVRPRESDENKRNRSPDPGLPLTGGLPSGPWRRYLSSHTISPLTPSFPKKRPPLTLPTAIVMLTFNPVAELMFTPRAASQPSEAWALARLFSEVRPLRSRRNRGLPTPVWKQWNAAATAGGGPSTGPHKHRGLPRI